MAEQSFAIPQTLHELADKRLKQAHAAYDLITAYVDKAMGAWTSALPSNSMTAGLKDFQDRVMEITKENVEAAFTFAGNMSKAKTLPDLVNVQTQFAQDRMQAFVKHTKDFQSRSKTRSSNGNATDL
jgi:hypothetical protein